MFKNIFPECRNTLYLVMSGLEQYPTDAATAYEFPSLQRDYILFVASTFKPLMQ